MTGFRCAERVQQEAGGDRDDGDHSEDLCSRVGELAEPRADALELSDGGRTRPGWRPLAVPASVADRGGVGKSPVVGWSISLAPRSPQPRTGGRRELSPR